MLFKLSVRNIRKSIKDYAIYFFTLIVSVAIFYLFSSIEDQEAFRKYISTDPLSGRTIKSFLKGLSIFIAALLGLLIVYANRFLMKRRHKEFAIYLMLGMGKRKISVILFLETLLIGLGSLVVGLIVGVGLSQFMSALVADLFEADLNAYKFVISNSTIARTILYFSVSYIVVMLFNGIIITKCKLINLMQSARRSEKISQKNPWLCVGVFIAAVCALAWSYHKVTHNTLMLREDQLLFCIGLGAVSTLLLFWSVSGLVLRAVMSVRGLYYKGLNTFTFRQISSKINTAVISMTIICLTLFITICTLSASFAYRGALNKTLRECCPADIEFTMSNYERLKNKDKLEFQPIKEKPDEIIRLSGADKYLRKTEMISVYFETKTNDIQVTYTDILGKYNTEYNSQPYERIQVETKASPRICSLSDYNKLAELFGSEKLNMEKDEYFVVADERSICPFLDKAAASGTEFTFNGKKLKPAFDKHIHGTMELFSQPINCGVLIVDDSLLTDIMPVMYGLFGYFNSSSKDEMREENKQLDAAVNKWVSQNYPDYKGEAYVESKVKISDNLIGESAMMTFIGLYLGLIFIIICAAVIALKQLSDCTDSTGSYEILRKIGAEEKSIRRSLFTQTAVFFFLPMLIAVIHSIFGLKICTTIIRTFSSYNIVSSILLTAGIIILIYGGYFILTYYCGRSIIRRKK